MNLTNISSRSEKKFIFVIEYNSKGCTIDELKLLLFYLFIYSFFFWQRQRRVESKWELSIGNQSIMSEYSKTLHGNSY